MAEERSHKGERNAYDLAAIESALSLLTHAMSAISDSRLASTRSIRRASAARLYSRRDVERAPSKLAALLSRTAEPDGKDSESSKQ
jgi:hypothetical protein